MNEVTKLAIEFVSKNWDKIDRKRITEEVQKTKDSIDAREKAMLNKMQESLTL